jgi:hypothetical protein
VLPAYVGRVTAPWGGCHRSDGAPVLPGLDQTVGAAGGWQEILAEADIQAQRTILAGLAERVVPERVGFDEYEGRIEWTPLRAALRRLSKSVAAA